MNPRPQEPAPVTPDRVTPPRGGRVELAIALDGASCVAVEIHRTLTGGARAGAEHPLEIPPPDDGGWPALTQALTEIREAHGAREGRVHFALCRPHGSYKQLELPALAPADLQRMLERGIKRFFPAPGRAAALVGYEHRGRAGRRHCRVAAAVASAPLVQAAEAAAGGAGYRLGAVEVGCAAAARGVCRLVPASRRGRCIVVLATASAVQLLLLSRGRLHDVRSAPRPSSGSVDELLALVREWIEAAGETWTAPANVVIAAPAECAEAIGAVWDGSASTVHPIRELSDLGVAAYGAGLRPPEKTLILTPARRAVVMRRARRREAAYGLLAGVLIVLCAQLYLGLLRARAEVVGERRAHIRPAVEQALHVRDRIEGVSQRVSALKRLHDRRSRSIVLFERLARALPNDAHLTSLRLDGSGLRVEGRARSATALVPVFQAAPWVRSVHLGSPLRREVLGGRTWERFSITLVLAAPDSARGAERP